MTLQPRRLPEPNIEALLDEIHAILHDPHLTERTLDEGDWPQIRLNPRTGKLTEGYLCVVCATNQVKEDVFGIMYSACELCLVVDETAARAFGATGLLPLDSIGPINWAVDDRSPQHSAALMELLMVRSNPRLLLANREEVLNFLSVTLGVDMWPDIGLSHWQANLHPSYENSAFWYRELLRRHAPAVLEAEPSLRYPKKFIKSIKL